MRIACRGAGRSAGRECTSRLVPADVTREQRLPGCEPQQANGMDPVSSGRVHPIRRCPLGNQRLMPILCCDAVAGFGKKRGPNSNPTS